MARYGLGAWAWLARRPRLYHWATGMAARTLSLFAGRRRRFTWLPMARGWTSQRDLPAPEGRTFLAQWRAEEKRRARAGAP